MTSSTEQAKTNPASHRRKHQWIGAATLVAVAALVLPWFLTPRFESIRELEPPLTRLPDRPQMTSEPVVPPVIDQAALQESRDKLDALMVAPIGDEAQASFILQVGAFKNRENAQALQLKLEALDIGRVYLRTEESLTRVYVGPLPNRTTARSAANAIQTQLSLKAQIEQYDVREHGKT
ncbi:MAG: SPOR domain-containing protein [Pseudomonadota bacterium]|nr:SPOR domain-containing protein [Pseudomonadota bacterium]MEC9077265.1 SPOR domain-containing protein [Pseudomonadota bacterium]